MDIQQPRNIEIRALPEERTIALGPGLPAVPERLLLSHARGRTLFVTGAGISMPSGLPDFRNLVLDVYGIVDRATEAILKAIPIGVCNLWEVGTRGLLPAQEAEIGRYIRGEYDVVLGMLERRMEVDRGTSKVRLAVSDVLRRQNWNPARTHRALITLADRGEATTILTTNFDLLLEKAARGQRPKLRSFSLGEIPRPHRRYDFGGVLHIHGCLKRHSQEEANFLLTDHDFGEHYLRRRLVPDLIYDAARLFNLVLVGYSANDPPMRYLLNAVAADGSRFDDVKERFAFVSMRDLLDTRFIEDWKARGITPIPYDPENNHEALTQTLERWASLSAINAPRTAIDKEVLRITKTPRKLALQHDRDLFDHLLRRGSPLERARISKLVSKGGAPFDWLTAIAEIGQEWERTHQ